MDNFSGRMGITLNYPLRDDEFAIKIRCAIAGGGCKVHNEMRGGVLATTVADIKKNVYVPRLVVVCGRRGNACLKQCDY